MEGKWESEKNGVLKKVNEISDYTLSLCVRVCVCVRTALHFVTLRWPLEALHMCARCT